MNKQFNNVMLDIETLGNQSYSVITSLGAVEFDIETGETGREFWQNFCQNTHLQNDIIFCSNINHLFNWAE